MDRSEDCQRSNDPALLQVHDLDRVVAQGGDEQAGPGHIHAEMVDASLHAGKGNRPFQGEACDGERDPEAKEKRTNQPSIHGGSTP